jgi:glycosyltransferase involved in cell wall biosynthesis
MKKILVIANMGWSIERVHRDVESALSEHYEFKFYHDSGFYLDEVMREFHASDLCLITMNIQDGVISLFNLHKPADLRKLEVVAHGFGEILKSGNWSPDITYGTVSDILLPFFPLYAHVVPNGVDLSLFQRKPHSGQITTLGWCGALHIRAKLSDRAFEIARKARLPVSIAETLSLDALKIWYHSIDVLLVTSGPHPYDETGPLPPFEAIACGTIAIGTNVGNFRKVPGPKFSTTDEAALILADLKADPERAKNLAEEQYAWVKQNWTYQTHAAQWKSMFDAAVEKRCV